MLAALVLWRRLAIEGPAAVGRTIYWGTAPRSPSAMNADGAAGGATELADVLESAVSGVETRFTVDDAGRVVAIDLWTSPDDDPCEIRFTWPTDAGGDAAAGPMPVRMDVCRGGDPFGVFLIEPTGGPTADRGVTR
jgi:hypothetical protein